MSELEIAGLVKSYRTQGVLRGLDLTVDEGSFVSILGPSGSGKTTLLRLIAGFERADAGSIRLHGEVVDDATHYVDSRKRRIGYVPQDGNLFPHMNVKMNVGFGLAKGERNGRRVNELLEMVGLGELGERYPHQLSGGQQQRVALARGLAIDPDLVLLDEPFSSLDASMRASVRHDVRRILKKSGATAILVTHDQDEALSLADKVAVIQDGRITQCDEPAALYARPASPELAREFGNVNFVRGVARGREVETPIGRLAVDDLSSLTDAHDGSPVLVLIRPEQLVLAPAHSGEVDARVLDTEFYGHDAIVKLRCDVLGDAYLHARTSQAIDLPARESTAGISVRGDVVAWLDDSR